MNCINCGAHISDPDLEYCPRCGNNVLIQKKLDYLSKLSYNEGLEKASIRDLSGAIDCLRQSLMYNKANIQARNLLGLVYFETGEVVAALGEWVISENMMPNNNLASSYINRLKSNSNKLEAINETIKKYNHALAMCREGHEDMAAIQLRKILAQNSKLIKGYHLLALIQMKNHEWNRARKTLKKAARIDKTNTRTLRFLREIDEQTGVTTRLENSRKKGLFRSGDKDDDNLFGSDMIVHSEVAREHSKLPLFFALTAGIVIGAAAYWMLVMPAIRQNIYKEANEQIVQYSESLATQSAELSKAQGEAQQTDSTLEEQAQQLVDEQTKRANYEALLFAYVYAQDNKMDDAAIELQKVKTDQLTEDTQKIYDTINSKVNGSNQNTESYSEDESSYYEESSYDSSDDDSYDSYEDSYDDSYDSY